MSNTSLASFLPLTALSPKLHADAWELIKKVLPNNPPIVNRFLQLVALAESSYGRGWKGAGVGSHNMGAITGSGPAGSFVTGDSKYDATKGGVKQYTTSFRKYNSDAEGFQDLAMVLLKPNVRSALTTNRLLMGVTAQYGNGYFTGIDKNPSVNVQKYFHFLAQWIPAVDAATGSPSGFIDYNTPPTLEDVQKAWDALSGKPGSPVHGGGLKNSAPMPLSNDQARAVAAASTSTPTGQPRHFLLVEGDASKLQALANQVKQGGAGGIVATSAFVPGKGWAGWDKHS